jgi:hypothetical protein
MKCPNDGDTMLMTVRMGIEIDFCPTCRGVFLDRGELTKLFEKEAEAYRGPATLAAEPADPEPAFLEDGAPSVPVTPRRKQDDSPWESKGRPRRRDRDDDENDDDDRRGHRSARGCKRYNDRDWKRRHSREQIVDSFLRDFFDL